MNTNKRKANSVEMKNNDHRGANGGLRRLRRPRFLITAAACAVLAAIPLAAGAAANRPSLGKPNALDTFKVKRHDSPRSTAGAGTTPTFSRTPSFAWDPVRGATRYQFELSTSKNFGADNSVIWSSSSLKTPAVAIPISLPWMTGDHSSLYWHVRAFGADGSFSPWSQPQSFNMRWAAVSNRDNADDDIGVPQKLPSAPGYLRWTPIQGATGYDVWFTNLGSDGGVRVGKIVSTITTVADEREYYTLRMPSKNVEWRVRARRDLYGETQNGLPRASYGPWSTDPERDSLWYSTVAGAQTVTTDIAKPVMTISARYVSDDGNVQAHALMPAFVFSNDGYPFHRVYIATDKDCVNIVHVGAVVGGTAYAPRVTGPLSLNPEQWDSTHSYLTDGSEGKTLRSDGERITTNETPPSEDSGNSKSSASGAATQGPPPVDLWDNNWEAGRYYWTVVPVEKRQIAESSAGDSKGSSDTNKDASSFVYQDLRVPQDQCQAGNVQTFKKRSTEPVLSGKGVPFVTGLTPGGRTLTAVNSKSRFYGPPLVAWRPSSGATRYDVEWSKTSNPWHATGTIRTAATSAVLPLTPGTWYYRVRGLNPWLPKNARLRWSGPMRVQIAPPTFTVAGG